MRIAPDVVDIRSVTEAERLAPEWLDLLDATVAPSYFATPDWALSWWETFAPGATVRLATWRDADGTLLALAPMTEHHERIHSRVPIDTTSWTILGSGAGSADHVQIPSTPAAQDAVVEWLSTLGRERTLVLANLDTEASPWGGSLADGVVIRQTPCPRVDLTAPGAGGSEKFRRRRAYYRRRLEAAGVELTWLPPGELDAATRRSLYDLHEARWEMKTGVRTHGLRDREPFFAALERRGGPDRGPCGVVARRGSETVGVLLGFWFGRTFSYFQTGWDPAWKQYDLGTALVGAAVDAATQHGAEVFDFLRGAEEYKYRFGAVDRVDETILVPTGLAGAALKAKYRAARLRPMPAR